MNWMSLKLHNAQLNYLSNLVVGGSSRLNRSGLGGSGNTSGVYKSCSQYKTGIHGGGETTYPCKDLLTTETRRRSK